MFAKTRLCLVALGTMHILFVLGHYKLGFSKLYPIAFSARASFPYLLRTNYATEDTSRLGCDGKTTPCMSRYTTL